jgi:hypothetical protein
MNGLGEGVFNDLNFNTLNRLAALLCRSGYAKAMQAGFNTQHSTLSA